MTSNRSRTHSLQAALDHISAGAPATLDLTNRAHLEGTLSAADCLLLNGADLSSLKQLEQDTASKGEDVPLFTHLAVKLALSKTALQQIVDPTVVSVVFAMYKEHQRMLPCAEHPHGEDFLRRKTAQLDWLVRDSANISWQLYAVDDGCPEGSGAVATDIIRREGIGDRVQVLWLEEAIRSGAAVTRPMSSTADSQKGGSIHLGMDTATAADRGPHHVVLFTDADLSTHLSQAGLLVYEILVGGFDAAVGSRREPASVVVKQGTRNTRGKLFIYLWKRLLPVLGDIVDTQCGFKAFRASTAHEVVQNALEKRFAFDIELLLRVEAARHGSVAKVPIAWIDSEAASTTTDLEPYLSMLKSIAGFYRHYVPSNPDAEPFAELIEGLDEDGWRRLVAAIPPDIANADPQTFGTFDGVAAADLAARAGMTLGGSR